MIYNNVLYVRIHYYYRKFEIFLRKYQVPSFDKYL